jgi:tRNA/rRNA methyltransferase
VAGTDRSQASIADGPAVILVRPQLPENIGASARAMANFGLSELRLVSPRDGWPNPRAEAMASGAADILGRVRLYADLRAATADLRFLVATTARPREMVKPALAPSAAALALREQHTAGHGCGLIFGPERAGLENDEAALAHVICEIPANPAFRSLNLAQAVLILCYEWFQASGERPASRAGRQKELPARAADLEFFLDRLEQALDRSGFLHPPEKRPGMVRNVRNIFRRLHPLEQELRTLQGILSALAREAG